MDFQKVTQPVLLNYLKQNGYEITRSTILRYVQNGYVTAPMRKAKLIDPKEPRVYYHPITLIELMCAILLHKGDFLEPFSKKRIPQFTGESIFLGRLFLYFRTGMMHYALPFDDFFFQYEFDGKEYTAPMVHEAIKDVADKALAKYNESFGDVERNNLAIVASSNYSFDMYLVTFKHLYYKHMEKFLQFLDDLD